MNTFFSTPKPFKGHIEVIQRNALRSWQQIHREAEVLLLGDDEGAAEVCRELGIRHIPFVEKEQPRDKLCCEHFRSGSGSCPS